MKLHLLGAAALCFGLAGQASAEKYAYTFLANPDADDSTFANPANDIQLTFGFDSGRLPSLDLATLNNAEHWLSGAIWLKATHGGVTVDLGKSLSTEGPWGLEFASTYGYGRGGFIEANWDIDEFLDIDLHGQALVVEQNNLPYDPFVYGQIDVYNNQASFQDAYKLWAEGDTSSLPQYLAAVPEPSTWLMFALGLVGAAGLAHRSNRRPR